MDGDAGRVVDISRVGGYVLAGGKSSRMGRDKARLMLGGRTLVERAVETLARVCGAVSVLSNDLGLREFAPVVRDVHPGCGPLGGIEAALAETPFGWSVFLPVDVPFLPVGLLEEMLRGGLEGEPRGVRMRMFSAGGRPQPAVIALHRDVGPYVAGAVARGELKLLPVLKAAAREIAARRAVSFGEVFETIDGDDERGWAGVTKAQWSGRGMWFANVNTPEDLARAEAHAEVLDTF